MTSQHTGAKSRRRGTRDGEAPHDFVGTHVSIAGGVELAPHRGRLLGCSAIQIFTKSNRQWSGPGISDASARLFCEAVKECRIDAAFAHSTYLINLAAVDRGYAEKSMRALADEIERCELLGLPGIVLHPGMHMGAGEQAGIAAIAKNLREVLRRTGGCRAAVFLENVAGQGTALGRTFEELAVMRDRAEGGARVAFCFDTCHALAAGYDITTETGWRETMERWDAAIGVEHIRAVHLNDSKRPRSSRVDRHEHIGRGHVGLAGFRALLRDARFARVPKVLETPKRDDGFEDRANLSVLRELIGGASGGLKRPRWKIPREVDSQWARRLKRPLGPD
ncbi:MAG: deoxyribonuclease IV [Candidatus Sumerlaeia bacterium]|nr:deoxyribonuclease IV [Candidatus Sumerlaeia bacterium]